MYIMKKGISQISFNASIFIFYIISFKSMILKILKLLRIEYTKIHIISLIMHFGVHEFFLRIIIDIELQ